MSTAALTEIDLFLQQYRDTEDAPGLPKSGPKWLPLRTGRSNRPRSDSGEGAQDPGSSSGVSRRLHFGYFAADFTPKASKDHPPCLFKGISMGDFTEPLAALLGKSSGLSLWTISRLKTVWRDDYGSGNSGTCPRKRYVYFWADGPQRAHG